MVSQTGNRKMQKERSHIISYSYYLWLEILKEKRTLSKRKMSYKEHCKWLTSKQIFPKDISQRFKGSKCYLEERKKFYEELFCKYISFLFHCVFSYAFLSYHVHMLRHAHPKYTHIKNSYFIFFVIAHVTFFSTIFPKSYA